MRIEPAKPVYRFDDRRPRSDDRREPGGSARDDRRANAYRAVHEIPHVWLHAAFGAHILGQVTPERATRAVVVRAYSQPEARTPLRPREDVVA